MAGIQRLISCVAKAVWRTSKQGYEQALLSNFVRKGAYLKLSCDDHFLSLLLYCFLCSSSVGLELRGGKTKGRIFSWRSLSLGQRLQYLALSLRVRRYSFSGQSVRDWQPFCHKGQLQEFVLMGSEDAQILFTATTKANFGSEDCAGY